MEIILIGDNMKKIIILLMFFCLLGCSNNKINNLNQKKDGIADEEKILTSKDYEDNKVDESGKVPIMMYHGIHYKSNNDTEYIGGNVDKDGYQRTTEAFINDLEFYYNEGYRMIRLIDYIDGNINVELGKSPIMLTFDDGLENNIKVIGEDKNGDIIIDPNSAVGILEKFKKKYPDYNVTATFFINGNLFEQEKYNKKILEWLINNGYDIGNHTYNHVNFSKIDAFKTQEEVGKIYELLDKIIPGKYVNIVALPYGSPYNLEHNNMSYILELEYNNKSYKTKSTLRVGWEAEYSPFDKRFNSKFLKRIRAYDNNGNEFDIDMNFKILKNNRYISDGNIETIVIPKNKQDLISVNNSKTIISY